MHGFSDYIVENLIKNENSQIMTNNPYKKNDQRNPYLTFVKKDLLLKIVSTEFLKG